MSRLLYIAVRGELKPDEVPASNMRRIYSSNTAAWLWLDRRNDPNRNWEGERYVFEVDLDEAVLLRKEAAPTIQSRYEHAERRATRWLALCEHLEPLVASGSKPSGCDVWKLRGADLARLKRVFQAWASQRTFVALNELPAPGLSINDALDGITERALFDVLAELLEQVDSGSLVNAELRR